MGIQKKEEEDICGGKPVGEDGKVDYKYAVFMYCSCIIHVLFMYCSCIIDLEKKKNTKSWHVS